MKICLDCLALNEYIGKICSHCEKEDLLVVATNEEEYRQLIFEYSNDSGIFVLDDAEYDTSVFGKNIVLLDNEKFVFFFKSEQDVEDFTRKGIPLKKKQMTIKFNCIKDVSFPRFYQISRYKSIHTTDVFSFEINTTDYQKIKFRCSSEKLDKMTCYRFFSQLIVCSRLFYRREGEAAVIHHKWFYVLLIALSPLCITKGWTMSNDSLLGFGLLMPIAILYFYGFTQGRKNKLYFTSQSAQATPHKDIVENESKRKDDVHLIQIAVILAITYLIFYFWWL